MDIVSNSVTRGEAGYLRTALVVSLCCSLACASRPPGAETPQGRLPEKPARAFRSTDAPPAGEAQDLNGDGKADAWTEAGEDGAIRQLTYDLDYDGRPDVALQFVGGELVRKELAFRVGGVPATWTVYERGELVSKERDVNGDGRADYWERFEGGALRRIEIDEDGDGDVDRVEQPDANARQAPVDPPAQK